MRPLLLTFLYFLALCAYGINAAHCFEIPTQSHKVEDVKKLLVQAREYSYVDYEKSFEIAQEALKLSKEINYKIGIIKSNYELGAIFILKGKGDLSHTYFSDGLSLAKEIKNELLTANGYSNLSRYYLEINNYPPAIDYTNLALNIFIKAKNQIEVSRCYSLLANIYKELSNYNQALIFNFKSLKIKETLNDKRGISIVLSNIGNIYLLTDKYNEAKNNFFKALELDRENKDNEGEVYNLTRLGVVFQKMGELDEALIYYKTALPLARESKFSINESLLLGNIGSTLREQNNYDESLEYLFLSLKIKEELKQYGSISHTYNDICETYIAINKIGKAKECALKAIEFSNNINLNQHKYGYFLLAKCDHLLGNYKSSYESLTKSNILRDSIFSIEKAKNINNLEIEYQTEKKEKVILLLTEQKQAEIIKRNNYIIGGLIISILLFLLYNFQRIKTLKNKHLLEKGIELDRLKSRFFTNISHEFRTPLTLILGPIDQLISETIKPQEVYRLQIIRKNAQRLLDQVNQLMDLSKIESGNLLLRTTKSDIIKVIRGVSMSFHSLAETKQIHLKLRVTPSELVINYDIKKIETIITNLLSNAFKFTPNNGVISIKTKIIKIVEKNIERKILNIVVSDSGIGIPKADRDQIFNRFYQSKTNQLLQQKGSGIGLAYLKELVELHQGKIKIKSKIGKGTKFIIQIPTDLPESNLEEINEQPKHFEDKLTIESELLTFKKDNNKDGDQLIILLIEDHEDIRNYIKGILGEYFTLINANDGEEGIAKGLKHIPDLIISDVMMPKKNGYEVCYTLKNDKRTSHIPIILLTGKSTAKDKIEGLLTKANDYITKPFNPKELLLRIKNLIESGKLLKEKYKKTGVLRPKDLTVNSIDETFLNKMIEIVEANLANENFGVDVLSKEIGLSRSQLHRKLKALLDQAPNQFIRSFRLQRAHDLLKQQAATPSEISYMVGFGSPSYFTKCFHKQFGYTPTDIDKSS